MRLKQKQIFFLLFFLTTITFLLFLIPNSAASENMAMIQMFQPDEATPLPYVLKMIEPTGNLDQALRSFVFYHYYYYGFPYFGLSALLLIPIQLLGSLSNITLLMVILRQFVSVLPMLAALLLLVFIQDGFKTYRSLVLFLFLMSVPAVIQNNLWWHPDALTFLFVALTLFLLKQDNLHFGRNFIFAAITAGIATAIKLMGIFFFLAIGITLIIGLINKKVSWKRIIGMALVFVAVMGAAFLIANPFLLSHWARTEYLNIIQKQASLLSEGFGVIYQKGLVASWSSMHYSFGEAFFLIIALGAAIYGAWRGPQRLLHGLILAWFFPVTLYILSVTHFSFQYWMPVALPLFSSIQVLLPEKINLNKKEIKPLFLRKPERLIPPILLLALIAQFVLFIKQDFTIIQTSIKQAENNPRIQFYYQAREALSPLPQGSYHVYFDYRLYVPETPGWTTTTTYDLLEYSFIEENNFDILLLLEQRILDYLNPEVIGVDPVEFIRNQQFYRDAENGEISGYHMIFRNLVGLVYLREDIYESDFK